jgi:hypothetical protein
MGSADDAKTCKAKAKKPHNVNNRNIGLNILARNAPYHEPTRKLRDLEGLSDDTFNPVAGLGRCVAFAVSGDRALHRGA